MVLPFQVSARLLATVALAVWLVSLAFTGLVLYSGQQHLLGIEILAMGWLSPLVLNFAWFANLFFLVAVSKILAGKVVVDSPVWATLLSLDTLRFSKYLLNEGGATTPIYGYGWGAVLWFLSIFLLVIAAGFRRREVALAEGVENAGRSDIIAGSVLVSLLLVMVAYFSIHDHLVANRTEAQRLNWIAFKRGTVCSAPEEMEVTPITHLSGPVEIVLEGSIYPFVEIKSLLDWGIPKVRVGDRDYSRVDPGNAESLSSEKANGRAAAILQITEPHRNKGVRVSLRETSTGRLVFDRSWIKEKNSNSLCPDYSSFPSSTDEPRRTVVKALGLSQQKINEKQSAEVFQQIYGEIVGQKATGQVNSPTTTDINCPDGIGWGLPDTDFRHDIPLPFMVREKRYHVPYRNGSNFSTCVGGSVYLYRGIASDGKYFINIEERQLNGFGLVRAGIIVLPNTIPFKRDNSVLVLSVTRINGVETFELFSEASGEVFSVKAALQDVVVK